jgi:hypothetical protein
MGTRKNILLTLFCTGLCTGLTFRGAVALAINPSVTYSGSAGEVIRPDTTGVYQDSVTIRTGKDSTLRVGIGAYVSFLERKDGIRIYLDDTALQMRLNPAEDREAPYLSDTTSAITTSDTLSDSSTVTPKLEINPWNTTAYLLSPRFDTLRGYSFDLITAPDRKNTEALLTMFFEEWRKYPEAFMRKSGLKNIVFVKDLRVAGQQRYAMPEGRTGTLYFNVNYVNEKNATYLRHSIHHEFYHLIEKNYFGSFYYKDPNWSVFNKRRFSYGDGGATAYRKPRHSRKSHPRRGFVTGYCTYGPEEDKAEIFAYLMTAPELPKLLHWMKKDPYLSSKVAYMMGFLSGLDPEMNLRFFLRVNGMTEKPGAFHFK